jgi:hypothetical protein
MILLENGPATLGAVIHLQESMGDRQDTKPLPSNKLSCQTEQFGWRLLHQTEKK